MAALILSDIIDRFQAVLEASPFDLKKTKVPFTHERQPNGLVNNAYRIEDGGLMQSRPVTNSTHARVDRLRVWIARKLAFDGQTAVEALEDTLVDIERRIKADGRAQSYHAEFVGRDVRSKGDIATAAIDISVDYDFSEAVA